MQPHDLAFLLAGLIEHEGATAGTTDHAHAADSMAAVRAGEWTPPPMHPEVSMPPAFMTLRPDVSSYLPVASADAPLARPRELCAGRRRHARP